MFLDRNSFSIKILEVDAGWMYVEYKINEVNYPFTISCVIGDPFECLIEAAYYFLGENADYSDGSEFNRLYSYFFFEENGKRVYLDDLPTEKEKECMDKCNAFPEGPMRMIFCWDSEGSTCEWTIERLNSYSDKESNLRITIIRDEKVSFEIKYRDFCYAIVKAYNDILMKQGILGYHAGTFCYEFSIYKLLYLKAFLMNRCGWLRNENESGVEITNIRKEIKLLLMEMD